MKRVFFFLFLVFQVNIMVSAAEMGERLQHSFIWAANNKQTVVFRNKFIVSNEKAKAVVNIFADSYYALYINGNYILSGPSRFDPKWPEYDTKEVGAFLKKGNNTIAVLVYGGISNGMRMKHVPGLALILEGSDFLVSSDSTWKCNGNTRFKNATSHWNGFDETIDATSEDGDCLSSDYDDSKWTRAIHVLGSLWGKLHPRSIPLLSEKKINCEHLCLPLKVDSSLTINFNRNYLISAAIDFEAADKTVVRIGNTKYISKTGRQSFRTFDSFGIKDAVTKINASAPIIIHGIHFFNRVYPFELKGSFSCSDSVLTRLWAMSVYTLQQVSEDGYQDCPWERAEWMGDAGIVEYPLTRVAFVGSGNIYSDPRLIRKMIRDIAQSEDSTGRIKAHHPSDRFDIHGFIEDYSCIWVQSLREYFNYTGDKNFVREMWPVLKGQMNWFLQHRSSSGLIKGREFVIFDNPLKYKTCEGATLNAFVYKAFKDASYLAKAIGDNSAAASYKLAAAHLYKAFNTILWSDSAQLFKAAPSFKPTFHSALLPLDRGVVSLDKEPAVKNWLLENYENASKTFMTYTHFWFFRFLYAQDTEEWDEKILDIIKARYIKMYALSNKGFTVAEGFGGNRPFHNFGAASAYFMSANILGVTVNLPLSSNLILIKPQLGYLTQAKGTVVTEHGLVDVSWTKIDHKLSFSLSIPAGTRAEVNLPFQSKNFEIYINGKLTKYKVKGRYALIKLSSGKYKGELNNYNI
ncbi:MAG: alpha-L-rhamnosidase C-terminal domain-containing protein [Bacteroidota bacterium]|nr:alpha-L-rhamnosidase C-terminal domain-containing protein [Bacteroidota bacterium]